MTREDFYVSLVIGFLVGLFGFAAIFVRVRRWPLRPRVSGENDRYRPPDPARGVLHDIVAMDRLVDLAGTFLVLALLAYGAVVAPRLRYILLVAIVTAGLAWRVWRAVMSRMRPR